MSIKLWETFFFLPVPKPWLASECIFLKLLPDCSVISSKVTHPTHGVNFPNSIPWHISRTTKKKIWNKPNPSCAIYNHIHSFNHSRQRKEFTESTNQRNTGHSSVNQLLICSVPCVFYRQESLKNYKNLRHSKKSVKYDTV